MSVSTLEWPAVAEESAEVIWNWAGENLPYLPILWASQRMLHANSKVEFGRVNAGRVKILSMLCPGWKAGCTVRQSAL
jgi:hypothetical protein